MAEDHLSNEVAVSAELTETGVKAAAKSRTVSSFDRLIGSAIDTGSAFLEGIAERRRAKTKGEVALIDATVQYGIDRLGVDDEFAKRSYTHLFSKAARGQLNREAVVAEAIADLRNEPPTDTQAESGPAELSPEFMDRFELYSEVASTEQLRERWGRVLASEIRAPGTFSAKCLRVIDELEPETAQLFQRFCEYRFKDSIPNFMTSNFGFNDKRRLQDAGLVNLSNLTGPIRKFIETTDGQGTRLRFMVGDHFAFALPVESGVGKTLVAKGVFSSEEAIQVHLLTDVGQAICSIMPSVEEAGFRAIVDLLKAEASSDDVRLYRRSGNDWEMVT